MGFALLEGDKSPSFGVGPFLCTLKQHFGSTHRVYEFDVSFIIFFFSQVFTAELPLCLHNKNNL